MTVLASKRRQIKIPTRSNKVKVGISESGFFQCFGAHALAISQERFAGHIEIEVDPLEVSFFGAWGIDHPSEGFIDKRFILAL